MYKCSKFILSFQIFLLMYLQLTQTTNCIFTFGLCPRRLFHISLLYGCYILLGFLLKKKKRKKSLLQSSIVIQNCIFRSAQYSVQCPLHLWPVCVDVITRPSPIYLRQKYPLAFWQEELQWLFVAQPL